MGPPAKKPRYSGQSVEDDSRTDRLRSRLRSRRKNAEKNYDQDLRAPAAFLPAAEYDRPPPEPTRESKRRMLLDDFPRQFKKARFQHESGEVTYPQHDDERNKDRQQVIKKDFVACIAQKLACARTPAW